MGNADFDNKFTDVVARNIWKPSSVVSIMKKESVNVAKDIISEKKPLTCTVM